METTTQKFPILIHEDAKAYQSFMQSYRLHVLPTVKDIKAMYEKLNLQEPFSDEVWQDIIHGGRKVQAAIEARVKAVREFLGVSTGLVKEDVMSKANPYGPIADRMYRFHNTFNGNSEQLHRLPLSEVVNVADVPEISEKGKAMVLEMFREYIQNEEELRIKEDAEAFIEAFNKMAKTLKGADVWERTYGPMFGNGHTMHMIISEDRDDAKTPVFSLNPTLFSSLRYIRNSKKYR
ncbi:hypothetical protein [Rufibacter sp. XAAS-G3-1]|uniref:hypothetical protein n=1 Tax=Rufibacter sp. XAAS-G3-1 TaxID=2729134 RepID=UPI0015E64546|nr:hypothetical protein [Rufibacter sp. XAAS-G3-1]